MGELGLTNIMAISSTTSIGSQNSVPTSVSDRIPKQSLGQDDFLKLLVAQLSTQDPLNPQKDTEFIAQLTQFNTLEQSRSMMTDLSQMRSDQEFSRANSLLGRQVEIHIDDNVVVQGVVQAVHLVDGSPRILVGGEAYDLSQVNSVYLAQATPN
jgi:flagellar basal-body rod modification protein FlgD